MKYNDGWIAFAWINGAIKNARKGNIIAWDGDAGSYLQDFLFVDAGVWDKDENKG